MSERHPSPLAPRLAFVCAATLSIASLWPAASAAQGAADAVRWFKGNTHTHTLNSDGDSTPDEVVRWYRQHGYQFVVLTDHNFLTAVDALNALYGADQRFLVMKGEELTDRFEGKPLHINGLEIQGAINPQGGTSVVDVVQRSVDAIRKQNGIPHINHPNFGWAISPAELAQVRNNRLFEVFNGHPHVNNGGGGGAPSLEEAWDAILSQGTLLYGLAVDDAHVFKDPWNTDMPLPGRGWVMVRASQLAPRPIVEALERGEFYSSTGVELTSYEATTTEIKVAVKATSYSKYRVQFIGHRGRLLHEASTPVAQYTITGGEGYVRVKVIESNGRLAWLQPIMIPRRATPVPQHLAFVAMLTIGAGFWRYSSLRAAND